MIRLITSIVLIAVVLGGCSRFSTQSDRDITTIKSLSGLRQSLPRAGWNRDVIAQKAAPQVANQAATQIATQTAIQIAPAATTAAAINPLAGSRSSIEDSAALPRTARRSDGVIGIETALAPSPQVSSIDPGTLVTFRDGYLATDDGRLLYTRDEDAAGISTCSADCLTTWQPYTASSVAEIAQPFSSIARPDGSNQWSFQSKPLYILRDGQARPTTSSLITDETVLAPPVARPEAPVQGIPQFPGSAVSALPASSPVSSLL